MLAKLMSLFLLGLDPAFAGCAAGVLAGCPPKPNSVFSLQTTKSHADLVLMWAALPEELRSITSANRRQRLPDQGQSFKQWITTPSSTRSMSTGLKPPAPRIP
jgi:hypothetical protein